MNSGFFKGFNSMKVFQDDLNKRHLNAVILKAGLVLGQGVHMKSPTKNEKIQHSTHSAMAAGEISSRFSMLHSSRNSKMGDG